MSRRISAALVTGLAPVWLFLAGCQAGLSPQAKQLLAQGTDAFGRKQYAQVVEQMNSLIRTYGQSKGIESAYCLRGRAKHRLGDVAAATSDLERAASAKDTAVRAEALVELGDIAYEAGDMALAENRYREALKDIATDDPLFAHCCFRLGCVLQRQGRWDDADRQFNKVIYHAEGSQLAVQASRRVHKTHWTIQAGAFEHKQRAQAEADRLGGESLEVRIWPEKAGKKLLFILQVGLFPTYEQAAAELPKVRKYKPDAFVTVTR